MVQEVYLDNFNKEEVTKITNCRACSDDKLLQFLNLGPTPIPNGFLEAKQLHKSEKFYPLDVCFCRSCGLVQLQHVVSSAVMFKNYVYIPSTSKTMNKHFDLLAREAETNLCLDPQDLVVDIGSNDGTLLKSFRSLGIKNIVGIDPAENLAVKANLDGIPTINDLFNYNTARKLRDLYGKSKLITGTNVLAHIDDLHDFFNGVNTLLTNDGVFIAEFPYFFNLLDQVQFDTIYQEHLSYFSVLPLYTLLKSHSLYLTHVSLLSVHGGSLRIYAGKTNYGMSLDVENLMDNEKNRGVLDPKPYLAFRKKVDEIRFNLLKYLWSLKLNDKKIVGYGASAKGNILLNYCRISTETLDYIVDSIPYKHGRFTPGMHIPIYPEAKMYDDNPDYALLLSWNFEAEILEKQSPYRQNGGKFIIPTYTLRVI